MLKLAQLQAKFAAHLLHQSGDLSELEISGPFAVEQLMGLYRNNFYISLGEYLAGCFPAVKALVGDEFFAQLAKAYVIQCPLTQPCLENYGSGFSGYIADCPQTQSLHYLADVAALDWGFDRAKTVQSIAEFPFAKLAAIEPQQQLGLHFLLMPETLLIEANYPLLKIWLGAKSAELDDIDMHSVDYVILHPDRQQGVRYYSISKQQYQFLHALASKSTLAELAELNEFQTLLNHFISENIINDFKREEAS